MRSEDATRDEVPVSRDGERPLPASRRKEHRAEDEGGNQADSEGGCETRPVHERKARANGVFSLAGADGAGHVSKASADLNAEWSTERLFRFW